MPDGVLDTTPISAAETVRLVVQQGQSAADPQPETAAIASSAAVVGQGLTAAGWSKLSPEAETAIADANARFDAIINPVQSPLLTEAGENLLTEAGETIFLE